MKSKIRNDILLALVLLLSALLIFVIFRSSAEEGGYVTVSIDGEITATYPLNEDKEIRLETADGVNVLKIEGGCAAISYADCRDRICAEHRSIKYKGETIVCLPHKLVITVEGEAESGGVDAVS